MNQTYPKSDDFAALQAHATFKLRVIERFVKRYDAAAGDLPIKEVRRMGCTILRMPYFRLPKPPSPRSKSTKPNPPASFIHFAKGFNKALAEAKHFIQHIFMLLLDDPQTPEQEADRLSHAILRCPLPTATPPDTASTAEASPPPDETPLFTPAIPPFTIPFPHHTAAPTHLFLPGNYRQAS